MSLIALLALHVFADEVTISAKPQRAGTKATIVVKGDSATISVTCPRGIGGAEISLDKGAWPKNLTLVLTNFKGLEGFHLTMNAGSVSSFLKNQKKVTVVPRTNAKTGRPKSFLIPIKKTKQGVEVTLPRKWLSAEKKFSIKWVDFYRG